MKLTKHQIYIYAIDILGYDIEYLDKLSKEAINTLLEPEQQKECYEYYNN